MVSRISDPSTVSWRRSFNTLWWLTTTAARENIALEEIGYLQLAKTTSTMDAPRCNEKERGENQLPPVSIYISIGELTSNWKQQPTWYLQLVSVEQMLTTRTFIFMSLKKTSPLNSRRCFSTNLHVQQTLGDTTTVTSIRVGARRTPLVSSEEVKTSHDKNYWHEKISNER